jgi:hypothetical protein
MATGQFALFRNTTGYQNTATGVMTLYANTEGRYLTATGSAALRSNTTGYSNVATGNTALLLNTTGHSNTATGTTALGSNTTGHRNTAIGNRALHGNTTGNYNTAVGEKADVSSDSLFNTIAIGYFARVDANNKIRMGNTNITHADIQVAWNVTSDRRWKENVKPVPLGLNFINDLKPVSYHRKNNKEQDEEFGIIAQELEETLKKYGFSEEQLGLLDKGPDGYYSVRYNDLIPTLIKAVQEQQQIIDGQQLIVEEQAYTTNRLSERLSEIEVLLASGVTVQKRKVALK